MRLAGTKVRRAGLTLALLLTLAATAHVRFTAPPATLEVVQNVDARARYVPDKAAAEPPQFEAWVIQKRKLAAVSSDIFLVQKPQEPERKNTPAPPAVVISPPPTPQPPIPVPPPQPAAPPLPFTYLGKIGENDRYTVFLSMRGRNYVARAGDTLAQVYRVVEIKPPTMTLMYTPMNIQQSMQIGESN